MTTYLFGTTVFLSSFLLFLIQPLISKHILAWFGGSGAVWLFALFFFMVLLAIGYIYALALSRLSLWYQLIIHALATVAAWLYLIKNGSLWPSPITPSRELFEVSLSDPGLSVFVTLAILVGPMFALLSSTSTLLQLWYEKVSGKPPFFLYGISNAGSLLGLLVYPVLFEPLFSTYEQGVLWSYVFMATAILLLAIIFLVWRGTSFATTKVDMTLLGWKESPYIKWLILAGVPVAIMLAGTNYMTTSVAPIPFLWVGPLALYLLSFVITFRDGARPPFVLNEVAVLIFSLLTILLVLTREVSVVVLILLSHLSLFAVIHWCHEQLYAIRPKTELLPHFYVALSLGGILGSIFVKILAFEILPVPVEFLIILVVASLVILYQWLQNGNVLLNYFQKKQGNNFVIAVAVFLVLLTSVEIYQSTKPLLAAERNFFGFKAVVDETSKAVPIISLQHGITNHGYQRVKDGEMLIEPVSYYSRSSGVGRVFANIAEKDNKKVLVAGLGSGSLTAYCEEGDQFTFIEIDEEVVGFANEHFTYLKHCPQAKVIVDDARAAMERLNDEGEKYDLIVLDVYADDLVPTHLVTFEAMALYRSLLDYGGVIAVHTSSRYLDLLPVMRGLSSSVQLDAFELFDREPEDASATASQWVLLAKDEGVFTSESYSRLVPLSEGKIVFWTDTKSALLPILRWF
jgi:16S rRNA G966 N2-methylase RsmD